MDFSVYRDLLEEFRDDPDCYPAYWLRDRFAAALEAALTLLPPDPEKPATKGCPCGCGADIEEHCVRFSDWGA